MKRVVAVQALGWALLLWLAWLWLGIGESTGLEIVGSAALAATVVAGATWLVSVALSGELRVGRLWAQSALLVALSVAAVAYLQWWSAAVVAVVMPLVLWRCRLLLRRRYWAAWALLLSAGIALPVLLVRWVPEVHGLKLQTASLVLRFGLAYLLAVAALAAFGHLLKNGDRRAFPD